LGVRITFTNNEDCAPASAEAIAKFEQENSLTLPSDYRVYLSNSAGGLPNPRWSAFGKDGDFVAHIYGMHHGAAWKRLSHGIDSFGHDLSIFIPVAVSNGGNYFLLRLAEPDRGAMYFWDHELEGFRPPTFESVIRVSDSFGSWLNSLQKDP
jgi:hypothetical protein